MGVRVEIAFALVVVFLCAALVTARPETRMHRSDGRVARAAKAPLDAIRDWTASLAEECLKAANGCPS